MKIPFSRGASASVESAGVVQPNGVPSEDLPSVGTAPSVKRHQAVARQFQRINGMIRPSPTLTPTLTVGLRKNRSIALYTSDAADERSSVDLGGRRIIKKK